MSGLCAISSCQIHISSSVRPLVNLVDLYIWFFIIFLSIHLPLSCTLSQKLRCIHVSCQWPQIFEKKLLNIYLYKLFLTSLNLFFFTFHNSKLIQRGILLCDIWFVVFFCLCGFLSVCRYWRVSICLSSCIIQKKILFYASVFRKGIFNYISVYLCLFCVRMLIT